MLDPGRSRSVEEGSGPTAEFGVSSTRNRRVSDAVTNGPSS
jgi:hypothetical protein